jgi:16S rRNA (guanine966-N2)-methyltransferase
MESNTTADFFLSSEQMRIIAGKFGGRELVSPPGGEAVTRPITDRAKQSLFDALRDCFAVLDERGRAGTVLDCFAGTGSMGLECLSRGAARAVFVERNRGALEGLKANLRELGVEMGRAALVPTDAYTLAEFGGGANGILAEYMPLTVAFVDPPYSHMETGHLRHKVDELVRWLARECMVEGGIISLRHPTRVSVDAEALGVKVVREMRYGEMGITWVVGCEANEERRK